MKHQRYAELVAKRKACRVCALDLTNTSETEKLGGVPDCDRVGGYSLWQGNLDAELMVVAQDFCDAQTYRSAPSSPWPGESVATNLALVTLARCAGFEIQPPRKGVSDDKLFFTNAVLCLKEGSKQATVPARCYRECGRLFLRPTIELVRPVAIAALGRGALNAILSANGMRATLGLVALINAGTVFDLPSGARVFPMCHPSATVLNTTRSMEHQMSDWTRMGQWIRSKASDGGSARVK